MAKRGEPFPDPRSASPEGIVAVGARPTPELLKIAYRKGIFPWPHQGYPLLWFSPDPRFVLEPSKAHLHRSLKKAMRKTDLEIKCDTAFARVMERCAQKKRPGQRGTWITADMIEGYTALHHEGFAHSVEAWRENRLVGGLYGVSFGACFYGESMFALEPDASKIAFGTLLVNLIAWNFELIDCQQHTAHLERFGAEDWPRDRFLDALENALRAPTREGKWALDIGPREAADRLSL